MSCSSSLADRPEIAAAAVLLQEGVEGGEQLKHDAEPMPRPAGKSRLSLRARRYTQRELQLRQAHAAVILGRHVLVADAQALEDGFHHVVYVGGGG
jgi:hypothetical protein